ncbi:MAG: PD40 domain-containing protein, partial [Myxococcales bacterium]|nr:PD40 domain-containing protein [Myxococcales bacterium]
SNRMNLTNDPAGDFDPAWSPDGTQIAFYSVRDGNFEIYVMNAVDGSNQTRLTNDPSDDTSPAWSP